MTEPEARAVTEFHVTYFGLAELESDVLLDLYADHAYKFAERHGHQTPLIGSRSWPTEEEWGKPDGADAWRHKAIRRNLGMARLERERDEARAHADMLQERIDAVLHLADHWEAAQKANREALERRELAPLHVPDPQDFRYAATGCLEVPEAERGSDGLRTPLVPPEPKRRLRDCVENWPEAETGAYDPSCCRFPKSCSATVYDEGRVTEDDLEPREATQAPAEQPHAPSGGNRTGGGLGERLRDLVAEPDPEESQYESVDVAALVGLADEAQRLEVHARVVEQSLRTSREDVERVRAQLVRMTKSSDEKTQRHGTALLHILDGTDAP